MFNVIKGNLINKNVKAVQISTERIVKEVVEKIQVLDNDIEDYENTNLVNEVENELLLEELEERILEKKKELESIHIQAIEIIENAKLEAQEIINNGIYQGEQESQSIKEKAWDEGYNEGLEQARRDMEENITSVLLFPLELFLLKFQIIRILLLNTMGLKCQIEKINPSITQ